MKSLTILLWRTYSSSSHGLFIFIRHHILSQHGATHTALTTTRHAIEQQRRAVLASVNEPTSAGLDRVDSSRVTRRLRARGRHLRRLPVARPILHAAEQRHHVLLGTAALGRHRARAGTVWLDALAAAAPRQLEDGGRVAVALAAARSLWWSSDCLTTERRATRSAACDGSTSSSAVWCSSCCGANATTTIATSTPRPACCPRS